MTTACRYAPAADIAAEVIDGEAVIIKLSTGVYYSVDRAGALIWQALAAGHAAAAVASALAEAGGVSEDRASADVDRVLATLVGEEILTTADGPAQSGAPEFGAFTYAEPAVTTYRDMKDLLALDPPAPGLDGIPWGPPDGSRE